MHPPLQGLGLTTSKMSQQSNVQAAFSKMLIVGFRDQSGIPGPRWDSGTKVGFWEILGIREILGTWEILGIWEILGNCDI